MSEKTISSVQGYNPNSEENDFSNDDLFNITSWGADLSVREIVSSYKDGDFEKPELQRNYVWDKTEASRFIESILMGLPIPSLFLANISSGKRLIIDGYQRIMSLYNFIETGIFSKDNTPFALVNSNRINERWRGKTFNQLSETDARKLKLSTIHAIIFEQKEPKNNDSSLYQVFERINTSGRNLNPQEIRNCIYQGKFNSSLMKVNKNELWRILFGKAEENSRMLDVEFILRFIAFISTNFNQYDKRQINLKLFFNNFMDTNRDYAMEDKVQAFAEVLTYLHDALGDNAFKNYNFKKKQYVNKFHATIFDSIAVATYKYNPKLKKVLDLEERKLALLRNDKYIAYISTRTTNIESIQGRIELVGEFLYGDL